MTTLIKNGELIDVEKGSVVKADLLIKNGVISAIYHTDQYVIDDPDTNIIDAKNKLIAPGLIDMHVHLREPGFEYKESIKTGTRAAVAGGFTSIACMPNTSPANDNRSVTEFIIEQSKRAGLARVYPVAAITKGLKGLELTEYGDLKDAGAVAISDDGYPVINSEIMRRAIEYATYHGLTVISHCEDLNLSGKGMMHEGYISTQIGLNGIPSSSEDIMVYREISLSRLTKCPVHIAHVSTAASVELIKRAKEEGLPVTAETAPHYFSLDHSEVIGYNTNAKVNPPLRTKRDVEAIKKGLSENIIDVIATDHAPHSSLEKKMEFDNAAFGMIGLETSLSITLGLVREGILTLPNAIKKMAGNPADILGIGGGRIKVGEQADLILIDQSHEYIYEEEKIVSKSKNSPFIGKKLIGRNELTMINGEIIWRVDS